MIAHTHHTLLSAIPVPFLLRWPPAPLLWAAGPPPLSPPFCTAGPPWSTCACCCWGPGRGTALSPSCCCACHGWSTSPPRQQAYTRWPWIRIRILLGRIIRCTPPQWIRIQFQGQDQPHRPVHSSTPPSQCLRPRPHPLPPRLAPPAPPPPPPAALA